MADGWMRGWQRRTHERLEVLKIQAGVFDGVVQQTRDHARAVESRLGEDRSHRHGMRDEGFAAASLLPEVGQEGHLEGEPQGVVV
jgi:hypothetical protein